MYYYYVSWCSVKIVKLVFFFYAPVKLSSYLKYKPQKPKVRALILSTMGYVQKADQLWMSCLDGQDCC